MQERRAGDGIATPESFDLVIEPGGGLQRYWRDLWRYRELFWFLAWRDILVRYKQTVIGIAWSVIRPLLTMIVFTIIFGKLARLPSGDVPYPIMVFAAMLPWQFFANALSESAHSLTSNAGMLTKIYFPRLIVPASAVIVSVVDFLISCALMALVMVWYRFLPDWHIITLPLFLGLACMASFGCGLWLAALNVRYRDFRYIVPFIVQFGLYVSPVGFSSAIVPQNWRLFYALNPLVGVIEGFRWALLGGEASLRWTELLVSASVAILLFLCGIGYFRKTEQTLADVI